MKSLVTFVPNETTWVNTYDPHRDDQAVEPEGKMAFEAGETYTVRVLNKTQLDVSSYTLHPCTVKTADVLKLVYSKKFALHEASVLDEPPPAPLE